MEPLAILFLLIVLALIVLFVSRPFFDFRRFRPGGNSQELSALLAERERLLTALQELDFDQSLGKIPAEDYPVQRAALLQKGAEVLRKLDAFTSSSETRTGKKKVPAVGTPAPLAALSDDDLEDLVSKRRTTKKEKTAGFCPKCGKPVLRSDVFCPSCGNPLK
jgi:hypothetical protein